MSFLSGIHPSQTDVDLDLMPFFVFRNVTTNSLPAPKLGPGTYCFLIQQTSGVLTTYTLEFVLDEEGVPTGSRTWGFVKASYR